MRLDKHHGDFDIWQIGLHHLKQFLNGQHGTGGGVGVIDMILLGILVVKIGGTLGRAGVDQAEHLDELDARVRRQVVGGRDGDRACTDSGRLPST